MTGRLHIHIHIHMSTYLYLSIYLPIYLSTYLSIYLPTHHLPTCASVDGWKLDGVPAATGCPIWGDATLCCFNSVFGREKMRPGAHRGALRGPLKAPSLRCSFLSDQILPWVVPRATCGQKVRAPPSRHWCLACDPASGCRGTNVPRSDRG